jgi:hypothetical protein
MLKRRVMINSVILACAAATAVVVTTHQSIGATPVQAPACRPSGSLTRLAGIPEASGLVASRATPGRLWAHNDSGKPEIFAIDTTGKVAGRVAVTGAVLEDWEAITSGPCGSGSCLYVGDIGDNNAKRRHITVYQIPEPTSTGGSVTVSAVYRATYPDGGHDAEALLAAGDGRLYIVTKGDTGNVAVYRFPAELSTTGTMRLERVGAPLSKGQPNEDGRITDGAISTDGQWVALRTRSALMFYRAADFLAGQFKEAGRVDLKSLGEPQGEGLSFGPSGTVYVAGEGGAQSRAGTFGSLSCPR